MTEFAVYVLRDLVSHHGHARPSADDDARASADISPLSGEEIDAIRRRLQSLGYL